MNCEPLGAYFFHPVAFQALEQTSLAQVTPDTANCSFILLGCFLFYHYPLSFLLLPPLFAGTTITCQHDPSLVQDLFSITQVFPVTFRMNL